MKEIIETHQKADIDGVVSISMCKIRISDLKLNSRDSLNDKLNIEQTDRSTKTENH